MNSTKDRDLALLFTPNIVLSSSSILEDYQLNKKFNPPKDVTISLPPEIKQKYNQINIQNITIKEIEIYLLEFIHLLESNFSKDYLTCLYNNINELSINKRHLFNYTGYYDVGNNEIFLSHKNIIDAIFHELFHMSSSIYDKEKGIQYSGFEQFYEDDGYDIGEGLDEGYTELLTHRYFGQKYDIGLSYQFEVATVYKLENIIGQEKMSELYFHANLSGLIAYLEQYIARDEIINFIVNLDFICSKESQLHLIKNKKMQIAINEINVFLIKIFVKKLNKKLEDGLINKEKFDIEYRTFLTMFDSRVKIGNQFYKSLPEFNLKDNNDNLKR